MGEEASPWVQWLVSQPGFEWMVPVDSAFIADSFNLYGLRKSRESLELITNGAAPAPGEWDARTEELFGAARDLYGLVHARFLLTSRGVSLMLARYENGDFGVCPRHLCGGTPVLPVGVSGEPDEAPAMVYCPRCEDVYALPASVPYLAGKADAICCADEHSEGTLGVNVPGDLDGSFFGPSFPHMLLLVKPQLMPPKLPDVYVPRVYGFRVHNQRGRAALTVGDSRGPFALAAQLEVPAKAAVAAAAAAAAPAAPATAAAAAPARGSGPPDGDAPDAALSAAAVAAASSASVSGGGGGGGGGRSAVAAQPHAAAGAKRPRQSSEVVSDGGSAADGGEPPAPAASSSLRDHASASGRQPASGGGGGGGGAADATVAARLRAVPAARVHASVAQGAPPFRAPYVREALGAPGGLPVYAEACVRGLACAWYAPEPQPPLQEQEQEARGGRPGEPAAAPAAQQQQQQQPTPPARSIRSFFSAASPGVAAGASPGGGGGSRPAKAAAAAVSAAGSGLDDLRPAPVLTSLGGGGGGRLPHRRSGVPLTSPYNPAKPRPAADDFNSDSDSGAAAEARIVPHAVAEAARHPLKRAKK
jgi:casein kinase II subunit beta